MSEPVSLNQAIRDAVANCAELGGGFPIAFTVAVDFVDANGDGRILVTEMEDQPTHRSMGLAAWLDAWYRDDATRMFVALETGEGE